MISRRTLLPLLLVTAALTAQVQAQEQRPFSPEIALDVRSARIAATTDDARRVAVTVQTRRDRAGVDHQRYGDPTYISPARTRLMVFDTSSMEQTWVLEEPAQLRGYSWSPDGERLGFFAVRDDRYELRIFDAPSGTTSTLELLTDKDIASSSLLVWSPDGSRILLGLRPDGWAEEARRAFRALTSAAVIVQDSRNDFLAWDRVRNIANRQVTALVSVADGAVQEILSEETPQGADFSADGSYLTYSTATRTKTSYTRRDGTEYALWMLPLDGSEPVALRDPGEERVNVNWTEARDAYAFSEDGSVFVRRLGEDEPVDVTAAHRTAEADDAGVAEAAADAGAGTGAGATGRAAAETETGDDELTPRFSVSRWSPGGDKLLLTTDKGWHVLDLASDELRDLLLLEEDEDQRPRRSVQAWTDDGSTLFFSYSAPDRWERGLMRLDVSTGEVDEVVGLDDAVYGSWSIANDGSTIVHTRSDGDRPNEIHVRDTRTASVRMLPSFNPQLSGVALARTELVDYLDVDGNTLYGILYYPHGYEEGRTYPLVAEIYEQFFDNGFNENMNLIAAQGWFGFRPSVRFEEGYPGEAWLKAVPSAINKLIERGLVDAEKVGVYGQSYGGYATNLLITQTDRFAAAANVSGKVNMVSFLGDSPKITTRNYAAAEVGQDRIGATLWEQPHKYIEHSAVMFADRIETPLLMLSGEGDWNVPATNQREMYYALRRLGKEVVWVHYTAGGHGAGRASTEEDFVDHWQRMFDWFAEHFVAEDEETSESGR